MKLVKIKPTPTPKFKKDIELEKRVKTYKKIKEENLLQLKLKQKEHKKKVNDWLKQESIDTDPYFNKWKSIKEDVRNKMLDKFIHAIAFMDGVVKAGEALNIAFGLEKVSVDLGYAQASINKFLKLQLMECFLNTSSIEKKEINRIWKAIIQREYEREKEEKQKQK